MNRFLQNRLVLQLLFTFIAAVSVAALSVLLVTEAVSGAESVVLAETHKSVAAAIRELSRQYQDRASSDSSWSALPVQARDISLRGITQTVLRSYPGVEGGFYADSDFLGYSFPTHDTGSNKTDVPSAERSLILSLARRSLSANRMLQQIVRGRTDLLVIGAQSNREQKTVAWVMKRLAGRGAPGAGRREILLAVLVIAALFSIVGTLATGLSLSRGVSQIQHGLSSLEQNFDFQLPERQDELGGISRSINRMASVRKKLERELRREDRLRALGRLAAGLAHEIRNPLNSIRLTVQLLERRLESNSIRREDLQTVQAEVDRLSSLLNDLLDLQRIRLPQPQLQSITPVLQRCISLIERQAEMQSARICFCPPEPDIGAVFDSQQLTQTVVNLLLNALEASPAASTVQVRASSQHQNVSVQIENEGPSLTPEQQEHLFEPFYTTKPTGTGLGLAVSRELMRSQGGDLLYSPSPDCTRFVVVLPKESYVDRNSIGS